MRANASRVEINAKSRDRLELVERSAGVAEAAPGNHGNEHAARRYQRRETDGNLVAHAARRMLVDFGARNVVEVQHLARLQHRARERDGLRVRHAAQEDGHEERGHLVVGDLAHSVIANDVGDLVGGEFATVTLLRDELHDGRHGSGCDGYDN